MASLSFSFFTKSAGDVYRLDVVSGSLSASTVVSDVPAVPVLAGRPLPAEYVASASVPLRLRFDDEQPRTAARCWIQRLSSGSWSDVIALPTGLACPDLILLHNRDVASLDGFAYVLCNSGIIRRLELAMDRRCNSMVLDQRVAALRYGDQWFNDGRAGERTLITSFNMVSNYDADNLWSDFLERNFFTARRGSPALSGYPFNRVGVFDYAPGSRLDFLMSTDQAVFRVRFDLSDSLFPSCSAVDSVFTLPAGHEVLRL